MHRREIRIKVASTSKEIDAVAKIFRDTIYSEFKKPFISGLLNGIKYNLLATFRGKFVGAITISLDDIYGKEAILSIDMIGVRKRARGLSVGKSLVREGLRAMYKYLKRRKARSAAVQVYTDSENLNAREFYRKVLGRIGSVKEITFKDVWSKTESGNKGVTWFIA